MSAGSPPSISVVLPVFRNRAQLPALLDGLRSVLERQGPDWEIVFVDDCGHDGAREWIAERQKEDARLQLVVNPRNLGQHASILRGLEQARGDLAAVMDADLQDDPEDLPKLLAAWRPGLGAVFARRTAPYQSWARHWSGKLFKLLVRRVLGGGFPERVGTFVVLGAAARRRMLEAPGAHPYLPLLVARAGLPLATVEIEKRPRPDGRSAYGAWRRARTGSQILLSTLRGRSGQR